MPSSDHRRRISLRPRAGGIATILFLGGLAVSAAATNLGAPILEQAQAHTAAPARTGG